MAGRVTDCDRQRGGVTDCDRQKGRVTDGDERHRQRELGEGVLGPVEEWLWDGRTDGVDT